MIGKRLNDEVIKQDRADYGGEIISNLSDFLSKQFGKGYSRSSVYSFLKFYRVYPNIFPSVIGKSFLSWTHYLTLIDVHENDARSFYEQEALISGWSVRQLQRAVHSQYYERLLSTQGKEAAKQRLSQAVPAKAERSHRVSEESRHYGVFRTIQRQAFR